MAFHAEGHKPVLLCTLASYPGPYEATVHISLVPRPLRGYCAHWPRTQAPTRLLCTYMYAAFLVAANLSAADSIIVHTHLVLLVFGSSLCKCARACASSCIMPCPQETRFEGEKGRRGGGRRGDKEGRRSYCSITHKLMLIHTQCSSQRQLQRVVLPQRSKHSCGFNYILSTTSKENYILKSGSTAL